jgi:hypothetical protein
MISAGVGGDVGTHGGGYRNQHYARQSFVPPGQNQARQRHQSDYYQEDSGWLRPGKFSIKEGANCLTNQHGSTKPDHDKPNYPCRQPQATG